LRDGEIDSVAERRRARVARAETGEGSGVRRPSEKGGTFSLFPSLSRTRTETRGRLFAGVESGVSHSLAALEFRDAGAGECWWLRLPRTELRVTRVVSIIEEETDEQLRERSPELK
jgi:hypothetical protein